MPPSANAHQKIPDQLYTAILTKTKTSLTVQHTDYITKKVHHKNYLILENAEYPEKPSLRCKIQSITKIETGTTQEDIYGQTIKGPHLKIQLTLRQKTP
jgi:hypothetical protein